jgi:hypothetical protein
MSGVSYINARGKMVTEGRRGLHPSEEEIPERLSSQFVRKIPLVVSHLKSSRTPAPDNTRVHIEH